MSDGVNRLGGNKALYRRLLGNFVKAVRENGISTDFDEENYSDITDKAHAIKGIAGNLSVTPVYEGYTQIVSLLRSGEPKRAKEVLVKITPVLNEIIECIEKNSH